MELSNYRQALAEYARETAADNDIEVSAAIRLIDEDPWIVAKDLTAAGYRVDEHQVRDWARAWLAA